MNIHAQVRACLLLTLGAAAPIGCNSNQGQVLALRDEFQRQMQDKDKTIEEQTQKLTELRGQIDQLQSQPLKSSLDPDKLASTIADAVSKQLDVQGKTLADIKRSVDVLSQAGGVAQAGRGGAVGPAPAPPVQESGVPSKPSSRPQPARDSPPSSNSHNGAIVEKFEFPK